MKNTKPLLIIACSKRKHPTMKVGPADEIYQGALIAFGLAWAKENNCDVMFLSALYGFIDKKAEIETYDTKFKKAYSGPFPERSGFFIGGSLYFKNAPARFQRLVSGTYGQQLGKLKALVKNQDNVRKSIW